MAKQTIANTPEADSASVYIGADSSNRWVKVNGNKIATKAQLDAVSDVADTAKTTAETASSKATAAQTAAANAAQSAATAQTAAETAETAATQAVVKGNEAIINTTRLWGMMRDVYMVSGNTASVYAGWLVTGLQDPTATQPPANKSKSVRAVQFINSTSATLTLNIVGRSKIQSGYYGELKVVAKDASNVYINFDGSETAIIERNVYAGNGISFTIFFMPNSNAAYWGLKDLIGCNPNISANNETCILTRLATVATSGSYNDLTNKPAIPMVDSALSDSSDNPVQNKVVTAALNAKADRTYAIKGVDYALTDNNQVFYVSSDTAEATLSINMNLGVNNALRVSILRYTNNRYPTIIKLKCSYDGLDSNEVSIAGMEQGTLYRLDILIMYASKTTLAINVVVNPSVQ